MQKTRNLTKLFLAIGIFAIGLSSAFSGVVYADDQNDYSHEHDTASWDDGLICGDSICVGQLPPNPQPVLPIGGQG